MGLYIRLQTSFWNHRKTIRLRAAIGEAALWIPPRLWSYAAENQPNGDFTNYSAQELAMLIAYLGDAQAMLEALQQASFMDGMKLHDWSEHNSYHSIFSERAKKAAKARWKGKDKTRKDKKGKEQALLEHATSIEAIYEAYPLKKARPDALNAIRRAITKISPEQLWERTKAYAKARNGDLSYVPNPSTWFNQERFNDDPSTWKNNGTNKGHTSESSRNVGTANEGRSSQYAGVGKVS